ncbi:hypothetical protein CYMTET_20474 [Cymbomonas tetramitiformis]|uniref:Right handed beta helix domain-containing protein n=1 Tax=Cymbomonas tetramitiformis TaxID=36881 RepID=A0AAE0L484_9CHLO|nr:hypothetical protein CYMTET_20474 [Cymbomonas tetramitiformis]
MLSPYRMYTSNAAILLTLLLVNQQAPSGSISVDAFWDYYQAVTGEEEQITIWSNLIYDNAIWPRAGVEITSAKTLEGDASSCGGLCALDANGSPRNPVRHFYVHDFGRLTVSNVVLRRGWFYDMKINEVGGAIGAAVYLVQACAIFHNSGFEFNQAGWGGAVYAGSGASFRCTDCYFHNNTADDGGAIRLRGEYSSLAHGDLRRCSFLDNHARNGAGVDIFYKSVAVIYDSEFSEQTAGNRGPAINVKYGTGILLENRFGNNTAVLHDDHMWLSDGVAMLYPWTDSDYGLWDGDCEVVEYDGQMPPEEQGCPTRPDPPAIPPPVSPPIPPRVPIFASASPDYEEEDATVAEDDAFIEFSGIALDMVPAIAFGVLFLILIVTVGLIILWKIRYEHIVARNAAIDRRAAQLEEEGTPGIQFQTGSGLSRATQDQSGIQFQTGNGLDGLAQNRPGSSSVRYPRPSPSVYMPPTDHDRVQTFTAATNLGGPLSSFPGGRLDPLARSKSTPAIFAKYQGTPAALADALIPGSPINHQTAVSGHAPPPSHAVWPATVELSEPGIRSLDNNWTINPESPTRPQISNDLRKYSTSTRL